LTFSYICRKIGMLRSTAYSQHEGNRSR